MIEAAIERADAVRNALTAKAAGIGQSRAQSLLVRRRRDGSHWRAAGLLWPLFGRK